MTTGQARIVAALAGRGWIGMATYRGTRDGWLVVYAPSLRALLGHEGVRFAAATVAAALGTIAGLEVNR